MTTFAASQVVASPSPATSGTSLTVVSGQGALFPSVPFYAVVTDSSNVSAQIDPSTEIIRVTAKSVDTFTIVRAQEGTTARAIDVGDRIYAGDIAGLPSSYPAAGLTSVIPGGMTYPPASESANSINKWFALQSHLPALSLIEGITYFVGTVSSGNVRVAMYDNTGTSRIANTSTAVVQAASETQHDVQFTSAVNAGPGTYYLLLWCSSATATAMQAGFLAPTFSGTQSGGTPTSVSGGLSDVAVPVLMTF